MMRGFRIPTKRMIASRTFSVAVAVSDLARPLLSVNKTFVTDHAQANLSDLAIVRPIIDPRQYHAFKNQRSI